MNPWCQRHADRLELSLRIQPGARRTEVAGLHAGRLKLRIAAPPVDGRANQCLLDFLAEAFGVPRSQVELIGGKTSRDKQVAIHGPKMEPAWLAGC